MLKPTIIASTIALAATLAFALMDGCGPKAVSTPSRLTIFLTADSRGYLEPCGCRRDQAGGLPGRATLVHVVPPANRVVVDAGNLTPGGRAYEQLKTRYLLAGMSKIGYDAVNLGKTEAGLDLDTLRSMIDAGGGLPFVSANVTVKKDGSAIVPSTRIVQRGGLRIGITGVTDLDPRETGPGVEVKPPVEALSGVVGSLRKQCDYLIVLAFVDDDTQRAIAAHYPEIDCILGGDVPQSSAGITVVNRASIFNVTDRGKVVGEVDLNRHGAAYTADVAHGVKVMGEHMGKDHAMVDLIARYKDELRDRRYELASAEGMELIGGGQSSADQYVGDRACTSCHANAHSVYAASAHAHAFETLVKKGSQFDPECLTCHTVGYGLYTGFVDATRTPHLANVQCENCHGRGKDHVDAMQARANVKGRPVVAQDKTLWPVTPATCIHCHDSENSENFHYATFWPRIAH